MSRHVALPLHQPEEAVTCDFKSVLVELPPPTLDNPITDYFATAGSLVRKIVSTQYAEDSEVLGLLVLGVVSSAEFYFRSVISGIPGICPLCVTHTELVNIPSGSVSYYSKSNYSSAMAAFEHESLADSDKIQKEIKRFTGFATGDNSSLRKALKDFESLCEIRHCFVHSRGFAGLKSAQALGGRRSLQKIQINQQQSLDFIKLSHNAVRAVNHFLCNKIINQWIDSDILIGRWRDDKKLFLKWWQLFLKPGEDSFQGSPKNAYMVVQQSIKKRRQGIAAKVARSA